MAITVTHADRVITNTPIIGVITQPYHTISSNVQGQDGIGVDSFIPTSHVKFLESAGARVVPVDYALPKAKL